MRSSATIKPERWAVLLGMLLVSSALHAQTGKDADFLDLLAQENQVFSASRYVQTIAETPANVSVVSREDIKRYGYRSINEALSSLPGVYDATSQWPALGVRGTATPGDFGSRILYLVNGMPIYEPTYGGFFIEYLDMESIERIEFVKGAGSALYGSGAVIAVVNLITRSAQNAADNSVALDVASHGTRKLYGSRSHLGDGGANSFVSVSTTRSRGRDIYLREFDTPAFDSAHSAGVSNGNDSTRNVRLFGRLAGEQAWLQGLLVSADKRDPLASYGSVFNGRLLLSETLGALEAGIDRNLGDGAQATARAYLFNVAEQGDYPYTFSGERVLPADYINVSDLSSRQFGMELRYDRFFSNGHHLLAGIEAKRIGYYHQVGDQPGLQRSGVLTVDTSSSYAQWAVFAQDEMRLGPGKLFLGTRFDMYRRFSDGVESRLSPRIAYVQDFSPSTTGKLIYGEAYRAPTVYESRYQDGLPAASTIWANPALRPELSKSLEALLTHDSQPGVQWRLSTFLKRLADSPVQVVTPELNGIPCGLGPNGCIQYRNSGLTQQVAGIEADVKVKQFDHGSFYASMVLQKGTQAGRELTSSPRRQFKAGISRELPWPNMDAALEAHYIGSVLGRMDADGSATTLVPVYALVNANVNAGRLNGGWHVSLHINNLLNRAIYTVASRELQPLDRVPADGRRYSLQLQLDF